MGTNAEFFKQLTSNTKENINYIKLSSDIKDYSAYYLLWIEVVTDSGKKVHNIT